MNWTDTIHSEVNADFVSNPFPALGERIEIRLQMAADAPVDRVRVRSVMSGMHPIDEMERLPDEGRFAVYAIAITITERRLGYHFVLEAEGRDRYFTRRGLFDYPPTEDHDFVILADFENPGWVASSVFYQIFPDRFARGPAALGGEPADGARLAADVHAEAAPASHAVREHEYEFDGHPARSMAWEEAPLEFAEGHCLDFFGGDLPGIESKIDYLRDLGVTALYLNPIFDGRTTHRYDCTDYFSVDPHLGGDQALVSLSAALHAADMRLMLDVSINHTGIEHVWFRAAERDRSAPENAYYYRNADGTFVFWWDVPTLPQLNYGNPDLRRVVWEDPDALVRYWLKAPFLIDAWRFDVAAQVGKRGADDYCHEVWREVRRAVKEEKRDAYIIGEHWEDNISYHLGDQWDGAMNYFASARPLRLWCGERDRFLVSQFGVPPEEAAPISGVALREMIEQHYARLPNQIAFLAFNLLDSHDIHRFHHSPAFSWELYRGIVMLLFALPGAPSIYYGDEVGIDGHATSIEGCRFPFPWQSERWNESFRALYRTLAHLKRESAALHYGSYRFLLAENDVVVFARFTRAEAVIVVVNRRGTAGTLAIPLGPVAAFDGRDAFDGRPCRSDGAVLTVDLDARESRVLRGDVSG